MKSNSIFVIIGAYTDERGYTDLTKPQVFKAKRQAVKHLKSLYKEYTRDYSDSIVEIEFDKEKLAVAFDATSECYEIIEIKKENN